MKKEPKKVDQKAKEGAFSGDLLEKMDPSMKGFYIRRFMMRKQLAYLMENREWKQIRERVLKRDGYCCRITGSSKKLDVHHIDGNRSNNDLSNLVTLSRELHRAVHYGFDPQQVEENGLRLLWMRKYVYYLKQHGYPNASLVLTMNSWLLVSIGEKINTRRG